MGIDIKLNTFEGPLDLLLHLIEKNKFNIFDIPIVEITEQYLEHLSDMKDNNLNVMSDFLVMAANLISIKSKLLLPVELDDDLEEEDPRAELVKRLLEYKMYKYASYELKDMEIGARRSIYKGPTIPNDIKEFKEIIDPKDIIGDITLAKLNDIFQQIIKRQVDKIDPIRSKFGTIQKEEIRIEDRMEDIRNGIRGLRGIRFKTLLSHKQGKLNIIVTFLAILELMKVGYILIKQEDVFGDIIIDSLE